jgi:hypothetical protein
VYPVAIPPTVKGDQKDAIKDFYSTAFGIRRRGDFYGGMWDIFHPQHE